MAKMAVNPEHIIELCERIQGNVHALNGLYAELRNNVHGLDDSMNCSELTQPLMEIIDKNCYNSYEAMSKAEEITAYIIDEMNKVLAGIAPPTMLKI